MVPTVAAFGTSFHDALFPCLHDEAGKPRADVAFTRALNLSTDDPDDAIARMADSAKRQAASKAASGTPSEGRALDRPTYMLAWAADDHPSPAQMEAAARDTLRLLALDRHEAFLIGRHGQHPHVHAIANRVHPETGRTADLRNNLVVLSQWAVAYEQNSGRTPPDQQPPFGLFRDAPKSEDPDRATPSAPFGRDRGEREPGD